MDTQKKIAVRGLILVLSLFLSLSLVQAADISQNWNCNTPGAGCVNFVISAYRDGSHSMSCGMARPVYNSDPSTNFRFTDLTFSAPRAGEYTCTIAITETGYAYYNGPQTQENVEVYLNGVDLGRTIDHRCNSGSSCASCQDGTTYKTITTHLSSTNVLHLEAFNSHALRSASISCNQVVSPPPTCTSFTYSNWSVCGSNEIQTRTVISALPANCINGNRVLTQPCNYIPPQNNSTNTTIINVNNTYIYITNNYINNYININITQNNVYNIFYNINNNSNSTILVGNNNTIYFQPVYNITVYVINNITNNYYYNYTIIYNNSTNNSTNNTNDTTVMPNVHIISPVNSTINLCSNNTLQNILASWANNISAIEYSFNNGPYIVFQQNMSLNFSYGWNDLTLLATGTNGIATDRVRVFISSSCAVPEDPEEEDDSDEDDCEDLGNIYSDEDQAVSIDYSPRVPDTIILSSDSSEAEVSGFLISAPLFLVNVLLSLGIMLILILLIYILI